LSASVVSFMTHPACTVIAMSSHHSGALVFLAFGSLGDALPLAIVAAEAAYRQLEQHLSGANRSVALLTHAQYLPRLKALTVP
jgi:predicted FMN-binding regulatory protein PaiB